MDGKPKRETLPPLATCTDGCRTFLIRSPYDEGSAREGSPRTAIRQEDRLARATPCRPRRRPHHELRDVRMLSERSSHARAAERRYRARY